MGALYDKQVFPPSPISFPKRKATYKHAKDNCHEPSTNKTFNSLLGGQLDQGCSAHKEAENVGPNIVSNDKCGGQEEPDQALKDVVDNEMALTNDQQKRHVSPCKLRELEAVVTLLQVGDKEYEAYSCKIKSRKKKEREEGSSISCLLCSIMSRTFACHTKVSRKKKRERERAGMTVPMT
jgi:hypothetical protein